MQPSGTEAMTQPARNPNAMARWMAWIFDRRHYTRLTTSKSLIPEIDGLRLVAIAAVFMCHLPTTLLKHNQIFYQSSPLEKEVVGWMIYGGFGVQLFFMISGFVLAMPFVRYHCCEGLPVPLGKYFLRRLTRLEPPYIVNLILCSALLYMGHKYPLREIGLHLAVSLGYAHNLVFESHSWINRVAWSLEIEVQFYLLAPLLTLVFRLPAKARRILFAAAMAAGPLLIQMMPSKPESLLQQLPYFFAGFLLVDLYLTGWLKRTLPHLGKITLLFAVGACWAGRLSPLLQQVVMPLTMLAVGIAGFCNASFCRWLTRPWISTVGGMCYTIYLYHGIIISSVVQTAFRRARWTSTILGDTVLLGLISIPLTALVCMVLFRLVERPCMRPNWVSQLWRGLLERLHRRAALRSVAGERAPERQNETAVAERSSELALATPYHNKTK